MAGQAVAAGNQEPPMRERSENRRRIGVVVDDDPALLKFIVMALTDQLTLRGARSVAEAREVLREITADLLILDIQLGKEDGLEFLAKIRQESLVPVLLITGHGSEAVAAKSLELRANAYLAKPFTVAALREKVSAILAEGPRPEHLAERARALIDTLVSAPIAAADIADRLAVKPRRLLEVFQARFGRTPMQYLREVRLRRAQNLLVGTHLAVAEIAAQVGFQRASYFDLTFKREFGVTPVEFRRMHVPNATPQRPA
jgi:YesN/AraC family two-component response regulator